MDARSMIIWALFITACAAIYIGSRKIKNEIEEKGIETTGVISRITDSGDTDEISLNYYARYYTEDGEEIEGILSNPDPGLEEGQQVRLKYHPVHKQNARLITDRMPETGENDF